MNMEPLSEDRTRSLGSPVVLGTPARDNPRSDDIITAPVALVSVEETRDHTTTTAHACLAAP